MEKAVSSRTGYVLAIVAAFLYALQVVVGKLILQTGVGARDLLVLQYTGATVLLFIFLVCRRKQAGGIKMDRKFIKPILIQGVFACCGTSFFLYLAMEKVAAGVCSMLLYMCPVYVCLFFIISGIRKITVFNKISVALAFVGAIMVLNLFGIKDMNWSAVGLAFGFLSGICYAFYGIYSDLRLKSMPVEQMLFYMYLTATATFWVLNPQFIAHPIQVNDAKLWILIVFVMLLQVMPMAFLNLSIRMIGSNKATVIATAELPFTIILAYIILREQMVAVQLAGIVMITAAVILLHVKKE